MGDLDIGDLDIGAQKGGIGSYTYLVEKEGTNIYVNDKEGNKVYETIDAPTAINWALNNLPTVGGKVLVKAGTYTISSPILIQGKNNVVLEGEGWKSTKLVTSGADTICIKIGDRADANKACKDIIVRGFYIDGSSQTTETTIPETVDRRFGIEIAGGESKRILIEENYVYNTGSDGIYMYVSPKCVVRKNIVEGVRGYWAGIHNHLGGEATAVGNEYAVVDNIVFNCNCSGIRHGVIIANNQLFDNGLSGATDGREAQIVGGAGNIIIGNHINYYYRARVGIKTFNERNIVVGNTVACGIYVDGYSRHIVANNGIIRGAGIRLYQTTGTRVCGNTFHQINEAHGILLQGSSRCVIDGNILADIGYSANNTYDAIRLEASGANNCLRNVIAHNQIYSGQANLPRYGIVEADANQDYNIIANNIVTNCATQAILRQGVNSIEDNNITA